MATAETLFEAALDQATGDIQLAHHAWRMLIDARANLGARADKAAFNRDLDAFLAILPNGPVQDSDCLDLLGYLLAEEGRHHEAADVYTRCLQSPTIGLEHIFQLVEKLLVSCDHDQQRDEGVELVAKTMRDLVAAGYPPDFVRQKIDEAPQPAPLTDQLIRPLIS